MNSKTNTCDRCGETTSSTPFADVKTGVEHVRIAVGDEHVEADLCDDCTQAAKIVAVTNPDKLQGFVAGEVINGGDECQY